MKKLGLIALTLVLALGVMGIGYAAWSQTLLINATVATGEYHVQFQNISTDKNELTGTSAVNFGTSTGVSDGPLTITIGNGAPGAYGQLNFNLVNLGSVPVSYTVAIQNPNGGTSTTTKSTNLVSGNLAKYGETGDRITEAWVRVQVDSNPLKTGTTGTETAVITIETTQRY
jgi:hypothetical protein